MSVDRMCKTKRRYDSRQAALFFATADGLRAYKCPHCRGWHLTSSKVRRNRPVKRHGR